MMKKISKVVPVLAVLGAMNLASSTKPVVAATTTSATAALAMSGPVVQWTDAALREGAKGFVAGAAGGALACALASGPGALAGAIVGAAGGYIGGFLTGALYGVQPVRGIYYSVPQAALNQ